MQQTPLNFLPYNDEYFDDWLDLAANFSITHEETFFIWNERPTLGEDGLSFLFIKENELQASIDLNKTESGFACVQWAFKGVSFGLFASFLEKVCQFTNEPIFIKIAHRELAELLLNSGGTLLEQNYSYFIRGDVHASLLRTDAFCDHYLCIANLEKYKTILNSDALVRKDFMKPIMHNLIKFNLPCRLS